MTDVHGLGAILYALLTGRPPFAGGTVAETLARLEGQSPEPPSKINRAIPRALGRICLKCLEKDPARRYPSALALADDLGRWLNGLPILARPVPTTVRAWFWVRRHPSQAILAGTLGIALACGVAGMYVLWRQAETNLAEARHAHALARLNTVRLEAAYREEGAARERERQARVRAEKRFETALQMVENFYNGPGDSSILREVDLPGARRVLRQAVAMYKALQSSLEGDPTPEARGHLAASYARLGTLTAEIGSDAEDESAKIALAALDKAIAIRQALAALEPGDRQRALDHARAWSARAWIERLYRRPEDSLRSYEREFSLLEDLARRFPEDDAVASAMSWAQANVGALRLVLGRAALGLAAHQEVLAMRERLLRRNPGDFRQRADLAGGHIDVGLALAALNRPDEAAQSLEHASAAFRALQTERPDGTTIDLGWVRCLNSLAEIRARQGRHEAMLGASREACAIAEMQTRRYPDAIRYPEALAGSLVNLACYQAMAKIPSLATAERAIQIDRDLVRSYPGVLRLRRGLASAIVRYILAARRYQDSVSSERLARRGLDALNAAGAGRPDQELVGQIAEVKAILAAALLDQGRYGEALRVTESANSALRALEAPNAFLVYNLACTHALLAAATSPGTGRDALANRAMAGLRKAADRGYRDAAYFRSDPDLAVLHPRADFQMFLLDLAFPAEPFALN
jgi:tetratricopeptide (TPR) repeat protein